MDPALPLSYTSKFKELLKFLKISVLCLLHTSVASEFAWLPLYILCITYFEFLKFIIKSLNALSLKPIGFIFSLAKRPLSNSQWQFGHKSVRLLSKSVSTTKFSPPKDFSWFKWHNSVCFSYPQEKHLNFFNKISLYIRLAKLLKYWDKLTPVLPKSDILEFNVSCNEQSLQYFDLFEIICKFFSQNRSKAQLQQILLIFSEVFALPIELRHFVVRRWQCHRRFHQHTTARWDAAGKTRPRPELLDFIQVAHFTLRIFSLRFELCTLNFEL